MATQNKSKKFGEKVQQALEKLGEALNEWFNKQRPRRQTLPVPVDRPVRKR